MPYLLQELLPIMLQDVAGCCIKLPCLCLPVTNQGFNEPQDVEELRRVSLFWRCSVQNFMLHFEAVLQRCSFSCSFALAAFFFAQFFPHTWHTARLIYSFFFRALQFASSSGVFNLQWLVSSCHFYTLKVSRRVISTASPQSTRATLYTHIAVSVPLVLCTFPPPVSILAGGSSRWALCRMAASQMLCACLFYYIICQCLQPMTTSVSLLWVMCSTLFTVLKVLKCSHSSLQRSGLRFLVFLSVHVHFFFFFSALLWGYFRHVLCMQTDWKAYATLYYVHAFLQ